MPPASPPGLTYPTKKSTPLTTWSYKQASDGEYTPCHDATQATSQIHLELLRAGRINDPFKGLNEAQAQWVSHTDWDYRTRFDWSGHGPKAELVFPGLDCTADVFLNATLIHQHSNAFHTVRIDVLGVLVKGANKLVIRFKSDLKRAKVLEAQHGTMHASNGDPSRVYVRKPQYEWGWDWGPTLITCGITRAITLETYAASIQNLVINYDLPLSLDKAAVSVAYDLQVFLRDDPVYKELQDLQEGIEPFTFTIAHPALWFPHRRGEKHRYKMVLSAYSDSGALLDTVTKMIGFRRIELVQEPVQGEQGASFYFKVNNQALFCVGSNWIPAHSFETALTSKDYEEWVRLIKDGHQDMVRVWGGGFYERDEFYEACVRLKPRDKQGILVWQDFMFACGQYPCYPDFRKSVEKEARDQLGRLRHHPCLAIFAGNNEDYQIAEDSKLGWDPSDTSGDWTHTNFPARTIYETVLPQIFKELDVRIPYHYGSPWSAKGTRDRTEGLPNDHQPTVGMFGMDLRAIQRPYQDYGDLSSRFISEFGMQSLPHLSTTESATPDPAERFPQSQTVEAHNKADSWERRLALYVLANVRLTTMSLSEWTYLTQLVQSEALTFAVRAWRRNWKREGQRSMGGALVWQMNDCWPCASWAIVDFYKRPKLAYYALKREAATVSGHYDLKTGNVWVINASTKPIHCRYMLTFYSITTGNLSHQIVGQIDVPPNQAETVTALAAEELDVADTVSRLVLYDGNRHLCTSHEWPQPLKHAKLSDPSLRIHQSGNSITVSTFRPVKGIELYVDGHPDARFSDNGFDLCPGVYPHVEIFNVPAGSAVKYRFYGSAFLDLALR